MTPIRYAILGTALLGLAACATPYANTPSYSASSQYARERDLILQSGDTTGGQAGATQADPLAAGAQAALDQTGPNGTTGAGGAPGAEAVNAFGISEENSFDNVSEQRSIEQDANFIASNRARYEQVQPTALPPRVDTGPNIVAYALSTNQPMGQRVHSRGPLSSVNRMQRNCAEYASPDLAQADFLRRGGPERDARGLDPDGDGYACGWDPVPFRRAAQG